MEEIFPVMRFTNQYSNIGTGGTTHGKLGVKLERPLVFDEQKFRKALVRYGVDKYKKRFQGAWKELAKK